jgi:hypothetical protein
MPLQRALTAVDAATDAADPGNSVTERHTPFGYCGVTPMLATGPT